MDPELQGLSSNVVSFNKILQLVTFHWFVVDQSTADLEIKGSNPVAARQGEKRGEDETFQLG